MLNWPAEIERPMPDPFFSNAERALKGKKKPPKTVFFNRIPIPSLLSVSFFGITSADL